MRCSMLRHQECTGQVYADAAVPFGERELLHRAVSRRGDAGVVDERIEAAEALHYLAHARAHRRLPRNVATDEQHAARSGIFYVGNGHPVTTLEEEPCDLFSDALRAARY